jgi:hypothetical protein
METKKSVTLNELIATYDNSGIPQWVLAMIADRISSSKVHACHWEDFFQDCAVWYLKSEAQKHQYSDVADSTRVMAGVNIILKTLVNHIRKTPLLQQRFAMTRSELITVDLIRIADEPPLQSLRRAVRRAVADLDEEKQVFCKMIMNMLEPHQICRRLGKSHWYYKRQILEIRQEFCRRGILDIIRWRRDHIVSRA